MDNFDTGIIVGILLGAILAGVIGCAAIGDPTMVQRKIAIERNCAHYDAQTGAFTWNEVTK